MRTPAWLPPALLIRGLAADRGAPDLPALSSESDPDRFVWRVLPYAARSFAASIAVLPADQARAAAIAYLYCRMLDTYEDLLDDPDASVEAMRSFAGRFDAGAPEGDPPPLDGAAASSEADHLYVLLLARCSLVDQAYAALSPPVRAQIGELVRKMTDGMAWSKRAFAAQGGVLRDEEQLARYCRAVIGNPAVFTLELVSPREITDAAREDALLVSEMIQLANVSRDIERDLARGIGYHPALEPCLGRPDLPASREVINQVREDYVAMALQRAPAYMRLFDRCGLGDRATVRTAAVVMILFTDLHYRRTAERTGAASWPGPRGRTQVIAESLPALLSPRFARRILRQVEERFLAAGAGLPKRADESAAALGVAAGVVEGAQVDEKGEADDQPLESGYLVRRK